MKRILIIVMALALAGAAHAKDNKAPAPAKKTPKEQTQEPAASAGFYKYLPEEMSNPASISQAEYLSLKMTAYNSRSQRIAAKLVSTSLQVNAWPDSLVVNTYVELTEKEKPNYLGEGKFNYPAAELAPMLQEGVDFIDKLAALYFAGLDKRFLVVNLYMKGALIGSWTAGRLRVPATGK